MAPQPGTGMRAAFKGHMVSVALFAADEDGVLVRLRLREAGVAAIGAYVMEVQSARDTAAGGSPRSSACAPSSGFRAC